MFRASCFLTVLTVSTAALAVSTSRWKHTTEADFAAGEMDGVVATNLGDLKLSRSVQSILPADARIAAVYAMAESADGTVYAATGPDGVLLAIKDGTTVVDAATFGDNVSLYALHIDAKGRIFVGTGGQRGELWRIDRPGEEPRRIFSADGVQYVWSIHESVDGSLYLGTGPLGQLFAVDPGAAVNEGADPPAARLVFDSEENNLLCVTGARPDGGGAEMLYVGSDPHGLLLRIDSKSGEVFVVYDAAETEISALAWDASGDLLAATAQATPDAEADIAAGFDERGRPDSAGNTGVPIDAVPPENPLPPVSPEPLPDEPKPIPKNRNLLLRADDEPPTTLPDPAGGEQAEPDSITDMPLPSPSGAAVSPAENGNAVYRIDRDGFVTEVFRANVSIYSMLRAGKGDEILVATGNAGTLFQLRPAAEETLSLAKVDPKQILSLLASRDGKTVYLGCANRGDVVAMTGGFAAIGTYTSPVLDAGQVSRFGQMRLVGTLPPGASLKVSTRSGNLAEPSAAGWSPWSGEVDATEFSPVAAPPARFLQYRLRFAASEAGAQRPAATPVVSEVDVAYQMPNLPPTVSAVRIAAGDASSPDTRPKRTITWEAADPNADTLKYTLWFRRTGAVNRDTADSDSNDGWTALLEDSTDLTFDWDTRTVGDGRYELRVTASDASANAAGDGKTASRVSEPLDVDNTPPAIGDLATEPAENGGVTVTCTVVDRGSTVQKLEYALDGRDDWHVALPSDIIADSPKETYTFVARLPGAARRPRAIALRASDSLGNQGFATVTVP